MQVALSLVLLVGAALFGRPRALRGIEPGFDRQNLLLFTVRPSAVGYQGEGLPRFFERIRPGSELVVTGRHGREPVDRPSADGRGHSRPGHHSRARTADADGTGKAVIARSGRGFFRTMRIALNGRDFSDRDVAGAPKVVVVNRRLARTTSDSRTRSAGR